MEQPSRRAVLRAAVLVAATAAVPGALATPAAAARRRFGVVRLRKRVFESHVGTSFGLRGGGRTYRAVLTQVAADPARPADTRFSLRFAIAGARPADGIYTVTHRRLAPFRLYVGAIGAPAEGGYEAVVNS